MGDFPALGERYAITRELGRGGSLAIDPRYARLLRMAGLESLL